MATAAIGALLGTFIAGSILLFAAGVRLARRGGRATDAHGKASAERIRNAANDRLIEAVTKLPEARDQRDRAQSAGTVRRSAADALARWDGARASAARSAQSFETFARERHDPLLARFHDAGTLTWNSAGVPQIDASWYPRSAAGDVARLNEHLRSLEAIRTVSLADGITAPLEPAPVSRDDVEDWNARLSGPRVDEPAIRRLVEEGAFGRDLLKAHPARRAPREEQRLRRKPEVSRGPAPDWLRAAANRSRSR